MKKNKIDEYNSAFPSIRSWILEKEISQPRTIVESLFEQIYDLDNNFVLKELQNL